ncbi:hypothetical protein PR048_032724 [Dryococelus australis]|uniref:Tc1-like transposase DDE domain-containing protein n=1 Tax=Dryococelus australis TaxID=614101 RepID=A0ABQ9G673_9NEOP|nr:hypothetical protein PR048_032724 [Dryococelus australis]
MERNEIVAWRAKYLRTKRKNDRQGESKLPITCLDETCIHANYIVNNITMQQKWSKTTIHSSSENRFIEGVKSIFKAKTKNGEYHEEINCNTFMNWCEIQLHPNVSSPSIIVLDNAPCHSVRGNKPPTMSLTINNIRNWLINNIVSSADERISEMLVHQQPPIYTVDELFTPPRTHNYPITATPLVLKNTEVKKQLVPQTRVAHATKMASPSMSEHISPINAWYPTCQEAAQKIGNCSRPAVANRTQDPFPRASRSQSENWPLVHTVFDTSWRTLAQSSRTTVTADNQCVKNYVRSVLRVGWTRTSKVKKPGSDTGDTNMHFWRLVASTRKESSVSAKFRELLTSRSREPMWVKRAEYGTAPECKSGGKRGIPGKTLRAAASSGTIPTWENPRVIPPGIEPGSPRWEARLVASHLGEPVSISGLSRVSSPDLPPFLHSGAAPCSPHFTVIGYRDLSTHILLQQNVCNEISLLCLPTYSVTEVLRAISSSHQNTRKAVRAVTEDNRISRKWHHNVVGMIIGFRAKGSSISETATFVNCSRASVVKVYREWTIGAIWNNRRQRHCVKANRQAAVERFAVQMNQGVSRHVSTSTVQRTLLLMWLRSRRRVTAPVPTQYGDWTAADWRRVDFFDESRFQLRITDACQRVQLETSVNRHPASIAGRTQGGGGGGVCVLWSGECSRGFYLGPIVCVEGALDRFRYESFLGDHVHPYMMIVFPREDGSFQNLASLPHG